MYTMPYKDRSREQDAKRRWYLKNKLDIQHARRDRAGILAQQRREHKAGKYNAVCEYKDRHRCVDCNQSFPAPVMEFDHISSRGPKVGSVAEMLAAAASWDQIEEEIAKCDLVCANCHRLRTFLRGYIGWG